jgi:PBP1b-binding outer membrane lipoprotein LpoB
MKSNQATLKVSAIAALLALSIAGCSQQPASEPAAQNQPAAETTQAPTAAAPAEALATFSAFAHSISAEATNKQCAIDTINGQPATDTTSLANGASAALGGWAGNGAGQVADNFQLVLKGDTQSYSTSIHTSVARPDVAQSLGSEGLANSGFTLNMSLQGVPAGNYAMYIVDPANPANACDLHRAFALL